MTRALITGGTGFIGKALVAELAALGNEVVIFDRGFNQVPGTIHRPGTILNEHDLLAAAQDVDEIYHLAGVLGTTELLNQPGLAIDVNIKGTLHTLETARICGVPRVFYCTKPNEWLNMYSITKAAGEQLCRLYRQQHGLDVRVLRWLNAYGPGQKLYPIRKAVPLFILQALHGLPVEIWGDGSQQVDLIHVDDLAFITVAYTKSPGVDGTIRDTGLCHSITVTQLASLLIRLAESRSRIVHLPMRQGEDPTATIPVMQTAVHALALDRKPTALEDGLRQTIVYYESLPQRDKDRALQFYYGKVAGLNDSSLTLQSRQVG